MLSESSSDVDSDDANTLENDIGSEKNEINVDASSESPFRALEIEVQALVAKLRQSPLLPGGVDCDSGERVRGVCCGFCDAVGPTDEWRVAHVGVHDRIWLCDHLADHHKSDFEPMHLAVTRCFSSRDGGLVLDDRMLLSLYTQVLQEQQQALIPAVGYTVNRLCIDNFYEQYQDEKIRSLICFSCAQVFVEDRNDTASSIRYYDALEPYFLQSQTRYKVAGQALQALKREVFDARYTNVGYTSEGDRDDALRGWTVGVPHGEDNVVQVVCCPEDRACDVREHARGEDLCEGCRIPLCCECHTELKKGNLPPLALANDNFTDFMLDYIIKMKVLTLRDALPSLPRIGDVVRVSLRRRIVVWQVTYAEIVAASIVHPTMAQMEVSVCEQWKQTRGHELLQKEVHHHEGVIGSIGSITAYVLGFEEYVTQLKPFRDQDVGQDDESQLPKLPLEPKEVALRCSFRLYATKDFLTGEAKERLLQQALIRAEVVVHLIKINVARKLPGYVKYAQLPDWEQSITKRAYELYPQGSNIHPDIASAFERTKASLDITSFEVNVGKAAVPAPPTTSDINRDPFTHAQPFGMGFGASASDGVDENERKLRGLYNLNADAKARMQPSGLRLDHGELLETFTPSFFCMAYPVLFPRGGAWIDYFRMPSARRTATEEGMPKVNAPRVDLNQFCRLRGRSAQKQFVRDSTLVFCMKDLWHRCALPNYFFGRSRKVIACVLPQDSGQ